MKYDSELILKILLAIESKTNSTPDNIFIVGYDYNTQTFPHLLYLYEEGLFTAKTIIDETKNVVQIFPRSLTPKSNKYLKELLGKK